MKFVSYNIQYGFGADGRYDLERVAKVVAGADVIALQEVERLWKRSNEDDQPEILARLLPHHHCGLRPGLRHGRQHPEQADGRVVNRRRQFGTMLLSRFPILWSRLHLLPMRKVVRPLNTQNAALEGLIRTPSGPVRVFSLHLAHIGVEERLEQIAFLKARHLARSLRRRSVERRRRRAGTQLVAWRERAGSAARRDLDGRLQLRAGQRGISSPSPAAIPTTPPRPISTLSSMRRWPPAATPRPPYPVRTMTARRRNAGWTIASSARCWRRGCARCMSTPIAMASDHFPVWLDIDLETSAARVDG